MTKKYKIPTKKDLEEQLKRINECLKKLGKSDPKFYEELRKINKNT